MPESSMLCKRVHRTNRFLIPNTMRTWQMGTNRNRKRIEKIERSLTPREIVASCIEEALKFESHENYALWVAEDVTCAPLNKMLRQIRDGVAQCPGYRDKHASRELLRKRSSEMMFLLNLFMNVNRHVHDFVVRGNLAIAALEQSDRFIRERFFPER